MAIAANFIIALRDRDQATGMTGGLYRRHRAALQRENQPAIVRLYKTPSMKNGRSMSGR
jgi:hypothetical protein